MKLAVVFFFSFIGISHVHGLILDTILNQATAIGAPFLNTGSQRLSDLVFGGKRSYRSSDIVLQNLSNKEFQLKSQKCTSGGWSEKMFPERTLKEHSTTIFATESHGIFTGAVCKFRYEAKDKSFFQWVVINPTVGKNTAWYSCSPSLALDSIVGSGDNNHVRLTIEDAN